MIADMSEQGPLSFRALEAKCDGVSPSVLNTRLKELRAANLVELSSDGYKPTEKCTELFAMLLPMREWSHEWADDFPKRE